MLTLKGSQRQQGQLRGVLAQSLRLRGEPCQIGTRGRSRSRRRGRGRWSRAWPKWRGRQSPVQRGV